MSVWAGTSCNGENFSFIIVVLQLQSGKFEAFHVSGSPLKG